MKISTILLALLSVLVIGCQPSQQAIQTALAETLAVIPTATETLTNPPLPTETPLPTVTATVLPTFTPALRVIDIDPEKLLLQKTHLPGSGKYYLPKGWMSPLTNAEIVSEWTVEEGQAYLADTGRIHGWYGTYLRGTDNVLMPEKIYDNVVIYSTIQGAHKITTEYDQMNIEDGYILMDALQIGDVSRIWQKSETDTGGVTKVWINVNFSYRNVYHNMVFSGLDREVSLDFSVRIANELLEDLKQMPLSATVTFEP